MSVHISELNARWDEALLQDDIRDIREVDLTVLEPEADVIFIDEIPRIQLIERPHPPLDDRQRKTDYITFIERAVISLPPPPDERIFAAHPSVDAFSEGDTDLRALLPDAELHTIDVFADTPARVKKQLAKAAMDALTYFRDTSYVSHRSAINGIAGALPYVDETNGYEVAQNTIHSTQYDLGDKVKILANYLADRDSPDVVEIADGLVLEAMDNYDQLYASDLLNLAPVVTGERADAYREKVLSDPYINSGTKLMIARAIPRPDDEEGRYAELDRVLALDALADKECDLQALGSVLSVAVEGSDEYRREVIRTVDDRLDSDFISSFQKSCYTQLRRQLIDSETKVWLAFEGGGSEGFYDYELPPRLRLSPLHEHATDRVQKWNKTGTDTYNLHAEFEASTRVIPAHAAGAWLEAFSDWPTWFEAGFRYVPIEPIQSVHEGATKGSDVSVVTTNLPGRPFNEAVKFMPQHRKQLEFMEDKIRQVLNGMKIRHGHLHRGNLVAVPYLNESAQIDPSRCPRLYAIDFDQAVKDYSREVRN